MRASPFLICLLCIVPLMLGPGQTTAQAQPDCGIVDAIDYPIDISETITEGYDDFGLFRARFGGMHTGIDVGFNRRGEPVHAVARGRVAITPIHFDLTHHTGFDGVRELRLENALEQVLESVRA